MELVDPSKADPSIVAADVADAEDITLSSSNTPQPVLASTAQKGKHPRDCRDMVNRYKIDDLIKISSAFDHYCSSDNLAR